MKLALSLTVFFLSVHLVTAGSMGVGLQGAWPRHVLLSIGGVGGAGGTIEILNAAEWQ